MILDTGSGGVSSQEASSGSTEGQLGGGRPSMLSMKPPRREKCLLRGGLQSCYMNFCFWGSFPLRTSSKERKRNEAFQSKSPNRQTLCGFGIKTIFKSKPDSVGDFLQSGLWSGRVPEGSRRLQEHDLRLMFILLIAAFRLKTEKIPFQR